MTRTCTAVPGCREPAAYEFHGTGGGRKVTTYACDQNSHYDAGWSTIRDCIEHRISRVAPSPADNQPTLFD